MSGSRGGNITFEKNNGPILHCLPLINDVKQKRHCVPLHTLPASSVQFFQMTPEAGRQRSGETKHPPAIEKPFKRPSQGVPINMPPLPVTHYHQLPVSEYRPPCVKPAQTRLDNPHVGPKTGRCPLEQQRAGVSPGPRNPVLDHPAPEIEGKTLAGSSCWGSTQNNCYFAAQPTGFDTFKTQPIRSSYSWLP
mmetsp:Transcript_7363/g.9961  ORF Transcript_7363/g.9961 Transcript_7363/m.9961 type:complete len:192 (-) Transcript_7363:187-762(-)